MALSSGPRENSGSSTRTRTIHIFDGRGDVGKIVRSSPLETLPDSSPCLRTALANHFRIRKRRIDVKHLGDPPRASAYAVLKDQHDEDIAYLFLAGVDETQLVLLAIPRHKSVEEIYRLIQDFSSSVCSRQLRLLREGQALGSGSLSDLDIRSLTVLQVVEVETKKMNVIYYQCGDVRKKFHPEVSTTATTREIKLALRQEVSASNLKHLESHQLIVSVGERVLDDDDFQPHLDVLGVDGSVKSRKLNDKYYIIQSFPEDVPRITIPFKYRRAMDKKAKERGAIVIVSPDASMKTVRDNIARFVSKPGNSLRLCGAREEPLQLSSLDSASVLQKTSLYAQPEPAKTVFVVVRATPSGQDTSIRVRLYNWDTVSDLKKVVAEEMKTHPELLCLEYGQQTLEEHDYLDAYRLQDKSTVQCRWYQPGIVITLYACRCSWHRILVHDATRTTVGALQRWQQTLLQASARVTLVQHGRPLDSDLCLAEAGIAFGARLRVICPEPVNAVEQPPPSCLRAFQTAESGCTEERFLSFPVKNNKPFYARCGTKLADLAVKENCSASDSSCMGMNAERAVVEGIHLLEESDAQCALWRRASHTTTDQAAKEDLAMWRNQSLFDDTTRQCGGEKALARNRSSSVHSETRRPSTLRDTNRSSSCMGPRGQYQETTRKPQAQLFLDDGGPNGGERQPDPRQLAPSADIGANVLGRDTFLTTLSSTTTTTTDGRLSGNVVIESGSDQITATHIHSPNTTDDEETERKYLCDDSQPQCRSKPLHSADTQVHQKQLPHQDIVAPDPLNGITEEKRLDSGFATSNHAERLLSSSECQRAAATEKEPSASAEMRDMDTPKSLHIRSVLKATNQLNGARTSQGRSGTNANPQFSVSARHSADVFCHGALCQGCLSPTNAGEMKNNTAETKDQEESTAATIATAICDSRNLLYEEKTERKSAACSGLVHSLGGMHDVANVQVCKEQRELEQNLTRSVPNVRAQEASTARESATQPHPQTSRPEISKPPSAPHELDLSLDFPEFLLETQPGCGGDGLVEENQSPTLASETSSYSSLGANEGHQTADQRQRKQVLHESRIRAAGKRQDLKRDATEMPSFVDDKTPQTRSDSPTEQTVATHHLGQGSTAQAAGSEGHDQTRVSRTRRKTINCIYESSKPNRRAPMRRSKTMTQVSYSVEEEEIVCHYGGHALDASPSKQKQLQATGSAKRTSDGDIIVWQEIFNCVADELVGEWPKIGIELGVPYKDIDAIKHKHHSNLFDAAFECLMKWRQMKGSGATAEKLQRALEAKGFRNIVETLSQKFPSVFCLYEESK